MTVLTRRRLLKTAAVAGASGVGLSALGRLGGWAAARPEPVVLQTAKIQAKLMDVGQTRNVLTYGDAGMPPVLRMKKGEPFAARLVNAIDDPTTIHWHGIRVPNKMDGVPFLVQPYVYTGDHFDYAFTPPDAGTFWYHPHCNTLEQMGHGLTGVIVVENPNDPKFDAEMVLNLRDWRLGDDGQFIDQFRPRDAAKTGTYGTVRTANWLDQPQYDAPAGGLVRLRVAITDVTRIYAFVVRRCRGDGHGAGRQSGAAAFFARCPAAWTGPAHGTRHPHARRRGRDRQPAGRQGHQAQGTRDPARDRKLAQTRYA